MAAGTRYDVLRAYEKLLQYKYLRNCPRGGIGSVLSLTRPLKVLLRTRERIISVCVLLSRLGKYFCRIEQSYMDMSIIERRGRDWFAYVVKGTVGVLCVYMYVMNAKIPRVWYMQIQRCCKPYFFYKQNFINLQKTCRSSQIISNLIKI